MPVSPPERNSPSASLHALSAAATAERGDWWGQAGFALLFSRMLKGAPAEPQLRRMTSAAPEIAALLCGAWEDMAASCADLRPLAERARMPVWLAWARSDPFLTWRANRHATRLFRKACATGFRGGRAPFLEDPDAFAESFRRLAAENL